MDDHRIEDALARHMLSRRHALLGGAALGLTGFLAACTSSGSSATPSGSGSTAAKKVKRGGTLTIGSPEGGSADTLDAHAQVTSVDVGRGAQLYEPLAQRAEDFTTIEMVLAESVEAADSKATAWIIKLRPGVVFHDGRPLTAEDVVFSLKRITDPKAARNGAGGLDYLDRDNITAVGKLTVHVPLKSPNANFLDDIAQHYDGIVPANYDPRHPVGTGPFKYQSFTAGQQSTFVRHEQYWRPGLPLLDKVVFLNLNDPSARINALMSGQVDAIGSVPASQVATVRANPSVHILETPSGAWQSFRMNFNAAPFQDVRVRQAFRLIVDRNQLVSSVLNGQGTIGNDLFARYDADYASDLPQRHQDLAQAKSLLAAAGHSDLRVTLTSNGPGTLLDAAQVFAQQAKGAGVSVSVKNLDTTTYFGSGYLKYPFAQSGWGAHSYLAQVGNTMLPNSAYNETGWHDDRYISLIAQAKAELDAGKRKELIHAAQVIEYNIGGYIIPYFTNTVDAYSTKVSGFKASKAGISLGNYNLLNVGFIA